MNNFDELRNLLKETRIKKNLSYKDLKEKTKIPSDIIQRIEEDPEFLEKNIYARMFLKQLFGVLGVSADVPTQLKEEKQDDNKENLKVDGKLINTSLGLTVLSGIVFMSLAFKDEPQKDELQAYKIILETKPVVSEEVITEKKSDNSLIQKAKTINLKAKSDVWITVNVDGELEVLNLKEGESRSISFFNKVVFETIGNASSLVIQFNNREVVIKREIVHNLFVDSDGIFLNGYNLIEDTERS